MCIIRKYEEKDRDILGSICIKPALERGAAGKILVRPFETVF